jgi:hypothetical protein
LVLPRLKLVSPRIKLDLPRLWRKIFDYIATPKINCFEMLDRWVKWIPYPTSALNFVHINILIFSPRWIIYVYLMLFFSLTFFYKVGITKIKVGITKIKVGITKNKVGLTKTMKKDFWLYSYAQN